MKLPNAKKDPNIKIYQKSFDLINKINQRMIPFEFNNVKALLAIAISDYYQTTKTMTKQELFADTISRIYSLQKNNTLPDNARSIGKKK